MNKTFSRSVASLLQLLEKILPGVRGGSCHPVARRVLRLVGAISLLAWLLFVGVVLALRYAILPQIADYRPQIERALTQAIGQSVRIEQLEARWRGLNPDLILDGVTLADRQGVTVFSLQRVEAVLSWQSLLRGRLILDLLAFERPVLNIRRESDGRLTVAGMDAEGESDPVFADWVLGQHRIRIRDATVVWEDRFRRAPPLLLKELNFGLDNSGSRHRFGLTAAPPSALAARLELRGEVRGDMGDALENLAGKFFVELDYADLAGWRTWLDYPVALPTGHGALRVWADFDDGSGKLTADLALEDLRVRLASNLAELDLASLRGRLEGHYKRDEWLLAGRKIELQTLDGLRVAPSDFRLLWRHDQQSQTTSGEASASFLDIAALAHLASYMPLDQQSRALLIRHRPQGRVTDLRAAWTLQGDVLNRYSLKAAFQGLGLFADGYFPGGGGLSGSLDFTEKSGVLLLDSQESHVSLPAVFPEPEIRFEKLRARASWVNEAEATAVRLESLEFAGHDAAGSVSGKYRYTGQGPGEIDLQARLSRADGTAVWRYMPHAVNSETRSWLRRAILAGKGLDGRLVLKGDLRDFPFRDPAKGQFLVTARAVGARLEYAPGWPQIEGIEAEMQFGIGMKIQASRGQIFGAALSGVSVEIPDFESHDERLTIRGLAHGPTSDFLRFIAASPIAESIDHFTDGMQASGDGTLDLQLEIPLRAVARTRMRGDYRLHNNTVTLMTALPPISQVSGRLQLTENSILAQDLGGRAFGGPVNVRVRSNGDRVGVLASGTANVADVSRHFAWPLLNHLSGSTPWRADIAIRKRNARVSIDSDLLGISSPLPEPLNKPASSPLPLHIERTPAETGGEQYRITLGKVAQGIVLSRQEGFERGVLAVGAAEPRLPESGLAIRLALPQINADAWRHFLPGDAGGDGGGGMQLNSLSIKGDALHLFGRDYHQVDGNIKPRSGGWQISLSSREAVGSLTWLSGGSGWLEGDFRKLQIQPASDAGEASQGAINSLPGMSLVVDDFRLGEIPLGRLEVKARNERGAWRLETLHLFNADARLTGKANWLHGPRQQTRLDFDLVANDVGRFLDRLGYAETVRNGAAKLTGNLQWNGALTAIHYPTLTGQFDLEVGKGQFNKLQPGVGKLLGLLSLQSLPRRLTLDFRDIFSDGLAFDNIEGKMLVQNGVMKTQGPLRINGPAAQIEMEGETDLQKETENLRVVVRPELGGLAAVGTAALLNPVAGAAALVANTVLAKPLNRLFSYRYHVTGTWSDPQISKEGEVVLPEAGKNVPENEEKKP